MFTEKQKNSRLELHFTEKTIKSAAADTDREQLSSSPDGSNSIDQCDQKLAQSFSQSSPKSAGAYPIKNLQSKIYAMLIFKHPDWLINLSSQSECLKN